MGFDNECILNIQSLAGEYFCPVCRLLVYPNEALQSQCTHLYCKPCLTYVVGTTQACPYDGYLVTEADSKSLVESNKALAETIGKITVHCLYHRSGCTWQGPLSECTSHCSGCAYGISPVVCNRCGIQIVHRQVQEHAQNCPGVQSQVQQAEVAQNAAATGNAATGDPIQTATQAGATTSQAQTSHSTTAPKPGQDPNQQANSNSQTQAVVQAAVPTPEQWYQQQQQQYQQYYQQYPGYDPYQQQYQQYYQQQAATQYQQQPQVYMQPQSQSQTQVQPQPHGLPQSHAPAQPQNQAPVNPQQTHPTVQPHPQTQAQIQPPPHGHPHPQPHPVQSHLQHVHMPQYQQPHSQMQHPQHPIQPQAHSQLHAQHHPVPQPHSLAQPQTHPQLHPPQSNQPLNPNVLLQTQHSSAQAVTGHHSYPSQQPHQQMQVGAPQQYLMHMHSGPHSQLQHPVQMQNQFPQQPPQMRPHATVPNQQQPALLTSPGQVPNVPPAQIHPHAHQSGLSVHQRPLIQPVQQPTPQQYVQQQQPFAGQPPASVQNQMHQQGPFVQQQLPVQSQLRPQGPSYPFQQHSHSYPQQQQQGMQPHQSQNLLGRPTMANHGVLSQPYPQSGAGMQVRSVQPNANQLSANQNNVLRANNQVQLSSEQQSGANIPEKSVTEREAESFQKTDKKDANDLNATSGLGANAAETKTPKIEADMKSVDDEDQAVGGKVEDKSSAVDASAKEHAVENSEPVIEHKVKEEATESNKDHKDVLDVDHKQVEHSVSEDKKIQDVSLLKTTPLQEETSGKMKDTNLPPVQGTLQGPGINESRGTPSIDYGPSSFQQRPGAPPPAPPQHTQLPGHPPTQFRPPGPGHVPHPGHPVFKQPHGPEIPLGGMPGPGTTTSFGRGPNHFGPPQHGLEPQSVAPQGPYNQGYAPYGPESQMGQQRPANRMEAEIFPHHPHLPGSLERGPFGQPSGMHSNMMRMNGAPGPDSSGLRDERFRPLPDECANPFLVDPARQVFDRVGSEEDLKQFPRPSHLDAEPVPKFGGYFSLSRPHRGHGFGMDIGSKLDPVAGPAASRSVGLHEEPVGRSDSARTHPDFLGPVPGYGRRHMDGLAARSPVREFPGLYSHGFGGRPGGMGSSRSGLDDIDGRDSHRFGDFHESRLPILSSHLRRGEFEGPGTMRIGEHLRSGDLIGHDILPSHLGRGEHFGPCNLRLGQPVGFGAFPGQARMGDFPPPRLGEPGFRSSFSIPGFPNDGVYRGDMESFDNSRKRKPTSMGWCRICKVDCETVEGLDLHSQTRDHQKMAMDMVVNIKQNAKKQKLNSNERSSLDDSSKSRNASFEGRGNKR